MVPVRAIIRACKRVLALITGKKQPEPTGPVSAAVGYVVESGANLAGCGGPTNTVSAKVVTSPPAESAVAATSKGVDLPVTGQPAVANHAA